MATAEASFRSRPTILGILSMALMWPMQHAAAACLDFGNASAGSECRAKSDTLVWTAPPVKMETVEGMDHDYDPLIWDPALTSGVVLSGPQQFQFRGGGEHVVEVFLVETQEGRDSFALEVDGEVVDDRYLRPPTGKERLRPKRSHPVTLFAVLRGGQTLTIRPEASSYRLSAIRWTSTGSFEQDRVPLAQERIRALFADPFHDHPSAKPFARCRSLQQLCSLLLLSRRPSVRKEAAIGLARATYWLALENHEPHDRWQAGQDMRRALALAPENGLLAEMISASCRTARSGRSPVLEEDLCPKARPVAWDVPDIPPSPGAPAWAVAQIRLAKRMEAITAWWVESRQRQNGEIGGGWGDDVEILRSWGPQAAGLGSSAARQGIRRMADGLWNSDRLLDGYDREISDVEHSSEPTTDTVPLRLVVAPHVPDVVERLKQTAACANNWITQQPDGHWRFRGAWFNCREFDPSPQRALDVHLNTRAMGPALWSAYLTRDPQLVDLLSRWSVAWVKAMRSVDNGKPAGVFPPVMRSADGSFLIGKAGWATPAAEWDYFHWSGSAQESLTALLLAIYDLTEDATWLQAAGEAFQVLNRCDEFPELCGEMVRFPQAFLEWRRLSGDSRYDEHFSYEPKSNRGAVIHQATTLATEAEARLSVNFRMLTSEAIFTDRVSYVLPPAYRQLLFGGESPRGDRYPSFAVTWPASQFDVARLVTHRSDAALQLTLFNFDQDRVGLPVVLWRLLPGSYRWEMRLRLGQVLRSGKLTLSRSPKTVRFALPPRQEVDIVLWRAE